MRQDISLSTILSCFSLIEKYVPRSSEMRDYVVSSGFDLNEESLKKEADLMMAFLGLNSVRTTVKFRDKLEGEAGSIGLDMGDDVIIEINRDLLGQPNAREAVLCVLAHEICHKLLFVRGLYMSERSVNEVCTDLATIYVGFGELTIRGCNAVFEWSYVNNNYDGSQTKTTYTRTYSTGYLTPKSYILAYMFLAQSYGRKKLSIEKNADYYKAKKELASYKNYTINQVRDRFKRQSDAVARNKKSLILIRSMLTEIESSFPEAYKQLNNRFGHIIVSKESIEKYPFGTQYAMLCDASYISKQPSQRKLERIAHELIRIMHIKDAKEHFKVVKYVECPFCGIQSNKEISNKFSIRRCGKCGRVFYWDSSVPGEHIDTEKKEVSYDTRKQGFLS